MQYCTRCNQPIEENHQFCMQCGEAIPGGAIPGGATPDGATPVESTDPLQNEGAPHSQPAVEAAPDTAGQDNSDPPSADAASDTDASAQAVQQSDEAAPFMPPAYTMPGFEKELRQKQEEAARAASTHSTGYGSSPYGQPQYAQSQYGQPQYGQPQYGQPQYGQPQYGQPQYGQPQYGQPQYGQSQYGQSQYGRPQYGQSQYEQSQYGQSYAPPGYTPRPQPATPLGMGAFLGSILLMLLPIAGFIIAIVWSCSKTENINRRNLARAVLAIEIACILLWVLLFFSIFALATSILSMEGLYPYDPFYWPDDFYEFYDYFNRLSNPGGGYPARQGNSIYFL